MAAFHFFLRLALRIMIFLTLARQTLGHNYYDEPELNVIPGKACGLQTEMRFLDALGKCPFLKQQDRPNECIKSINIIR